MDRKAIVNLQGGIGNAQALLEQYKEELDELLSDLRDRLDNTPEGLQSSESYSRRESEVGSLERAVSELDDSIESAQSTIDNIEEALNA
jgi:peptidoglycan hydrolase CwlO-like protein